MAPLGFSIDGFKPFLGDRKYLLLIINSDKMLNFYLIYNEKVRISLKIDRFKNPLDGFHGANQNHSNGASIVRTTVKIR